MCLQCMISNFQIISEMLPGIHTLEKFGFLKSVIHFQIIARPVNVLR